MIISVKRKKYDQRFESWYDTKSKWFYVHIIDQGITIDFSPKTFRTFLEYLQSINLEKDFEQLFLFSVFEIEWFLQFYKCFGMLILLSPLGQDHWCQSLKKSLGDLSQLSQ